jgi:hypothetical protein
MADFSFLENENTPRKEILSYEEKEVDMILSVLEKEGIIVNEVHKQMLKVEDVVPAAEMKEIQFGSISMQVGHHESDFAISLWPNTSNILMIKNVQGKQSAIIMQLIRVLQEYVPDYLRVNIFPPAREYDVAVFSIKILGAMDALGFDVESLRTELPEKLARAFMAGLK